MTRRRLRLALPLLVLSAATAQAPRPAVPAVPERPVFVLQLDGPAALWRRFLPTDVGSMLASKDAEGFWKLLQAPMQAAVASIGGSDAEVRNAVDAWRGYAGRITLAIDLPAEPPGLEDATGFVVLTGDGETDLSALGTALRRAAEQHGAKLDAIAIGDRAVVVARTSHEWCFTMPFPVDGHEVVAFGTHVEPALRRALEGPGFRPDAELAASPVGAHLDLARVVAGMRHELAEFLEEPKATDVMRALGFDSLRELRVLARPSGPHVELETSLRFGDGERGMFGGLFPAHPEAPRLQHLVPPGTRNWQVVPQRWDRAFGALFTAGESFSLRAMAKDTWGVDVQHDVFAHLGDEVLMLGDVIGTGEDQAETGTAALVFAVRDAEALDARLAEARACLDYEADDDAVDGVTIWRSREMFAPDAFARIDGWLVLAWGDRRTEWIGGVARRAREAQPEPPEAAAFARLQRHAPPGFDGQGRVAVGAISSLLFDLFSGALPDELEGALGSSSDELHRLLRARGVDRAYVMTGHDGDRWRARVFW